MEPELPIWLLATPPPPTYSLLFTTDIQPPVQPGKYVHYCCQQKKDDKVLFNIKYAVSPSLKCESLLKWFTIQLHINNMWLKQNPFKTKAVLV